MHLMPHSCKAQTANSRDDPHPKLSPPINICELRHGSRFRMKSGFSSPSGVKRRRRNACLACSPRAIVAPAVAGQIISVSTLSIGNGAAIAVSVLNGSATILAPFPDVHKMACYAARHSHGRADQMGANIAPLPVLKVTVRRCRDTCTSDRGIPAAAHGTS